MTIGKICRANVITDLPDTAILDIAKSMKTHNVGDVVIVGTRNEPIGIVTDRDIAIKVVADDVDPTDPTASDLMSDDLLILKDHHGVQEAFDMMCAKGVRRAPVVNDSNTLIGVLSIDDLALLLCDEMESYGKLLRKQMARVRA